MAYIKEHQKEQPHGSRLAKGHAIRNGLCDKSHSIQGDALPLSKLRQQENDERPRVEQPDHADLVFSGKVDFDNACLPRERFSSLVYHEFDHGDVDSDRPWFERALEQ